MRKHDQTKKSFNCNAKKRFPLRVPLPLQDSPHVVPSSPCPRTTGRLHDKRQRRCDKCHGSSPSINSSTWTHLAVMTCCTPSCSRSTSPVEAGGSDLSSIGLSVPLDNLLRDLWEVANLVSTCRAPHVVQHSDSSVKGRFAHRTNA